MYSRATLAVALCALSLAAAPAAAALYKWTDENGRVVYGDTPPAGVKVERVNAAAPPADPSAVRDLAAKDAQFKARQRARAEEEAKADKAQADAKAKVERCAQLRGNIQTMRSGTAVYRFSDKGEKIYLDGADREKSIAESERQLRSLNCESAPAS
ncbi:MAG TPA: DUF4124 domain-containing protein [Casimicrobiaceae bacterium]|nr:DUF4124 domain-containing protein [Casimicrobiaceae bacterium]